MNLLPVPATRVRYIRLCIEIGSESGGLYPGGRGGGSAFLDKIMNDYGGLSPLFSP